MTFGFVFSTTLFINIHNKVNANINKLEYFILTDINALGFKMKLTEMDVVAFYLFFSDRASSLSFLK
jgi:hypothetical protein